MQHHDQSNVEESVGSNREHGDGFSIGHQCYIGKRMGKLLFDERTSDMTLIVEGEALPAHRAILATSSDFFR